MACGARREKRGSPKSAPTGRGMPIKLPGQKSKGKPMLASTPWNDPMAMAIGWFYLVTNSVRILTYLPQIIAVWRCRDGARAISLLTWGSWSISNVAAVLYGMLVVHDAFFVAISTINLIGCGAVTVIAARRRISVTTLVPVRSEADLSASRVASRWQRSTPKESHRHSGTQEAGSSCACFTPPSKSVHPPAFAQPPWPATHRDAG